MKADGIVKNCEMCGKSMSGHRFCSLYCYRKWQSINNSGSNNPTYSKVEIICSSCGNPFLVKRSHLKIIKNCSPQCRSKSLSLSQSGSNNPSWRGGGTLKNCEYCDSSFVTSEKRIEIGKGKYCSHKCYSQHAKGKPKIRIAISNCRKENHPRWRGGPIKIPCLHCGQVFSANRGRIKKGRAKFCSRSCKGSWMSLNCRGKNHPLYMGDKFNRLYPRDFMFVRQVIRERDGYECAICGKNDNGRKLSIHHIDYNKNNLVPTNLIGLCHSCHARTNYNRGYWHYVLNKTTEFIYAQV